MTQIRVCILLLQGYKNRYTYFFLFVYLIQKMSVCILRFILVSGLWASPKSICSLLSASEQILFCICPHHKGSDKYKKVFALRPLPSSQILFGRAPSDPHPRIHPKILTHFFVCGTLTRKNTCNYIQYLVSTTDKYCN